MSFPTIGLMAVPYCVSHPPPDAPRTCALTSCPPPQRASCMSANVPGRGRYVS